MELNKMNINWYPGHMKKTRELVQNNLKLVDVVVELLDARIPLSSKNPDIDNLVKDKPRVVALNKSDICEDKNLREWVEFYKEKGIKAVPINAMNGRGIDALVNECRNKTADMMKALEKKGIKNRPIRMMIVGIPNVGKSSLINRLSGRKSTQTGDRPGVTKGKQWVKLKGNMELLDTPGILWPRFEDYEVALNLAFTGAIKDEVLDTETLALRLIERLMDGYMTNLVERYKIENREYESGLELMEAIAEKRGFKLRGNEYDYERTALTVLNEFREGKLGRISLERP